MTDKRTKRERAEAAATTCGELITGSTWTGNAAKVIESNFSDLPEPAEVEAMRGEIELANAEIRRLDAKAIQIAQNRNEHDDSLRAEIGRLGNELEELKEKFCSRGIDLSNAIHDRARIRVEIVGALTDAGIAMLADSDPTATGEIRMAIKKLAYQRDVLETTCSAHVTVISDFEKDVERLTAEASRTRLAHENLRERLAKAEGERDDLARWKRDAMAVEAEWDEQDLAKKVGARIGDSCRRIITRGIEELVRLRSEIARKDEALREIREKCRCTELCKCSGHMRILAGMALAPPAQEAKAAHDDASCPHAPRGAEYNWATDERPGSTTVNAMPLDLGAKPEPAHPPCVAAALRVIAGIAEEPMFTDAAPDGSRGRYVSHAARLRQVAAEIEKAGKL